MDRNRRRYGRWWSKCRLLLAGTVVLVLGMGLGLRCELRYIDNDLNLIIRVVHLCRIVGRGHAMALIAWASRRCVYLASFPLPRRYAWRHRMAAHERACGGRFVGDVMTTSTLPLLLKDSARVFLHSRRVLPLATGGP